MKKIISIGLKVFGLLSLLFFLFILVWWWLQPKLPPDHTIIGKEFLASENYREVADSSIYQLQKVMKELELPSVSTAVSLNGKIVWACTFGYSHIKNKKRPELSTLYRAGSVSKSMTGLAAAKLYEEGLIDLEKSVYDYVPSFPKKRWDFKVRHLGSHTSGIRHYADPGHQSFWAEQFSKHHYSSVEESLEIFKEDSLLFQPGTNFQYSTHGFTLLSAAMEQATGKDFVTIMQEYLWTPCKMVDTKPDNLNRKDPNRAVPYTQIAGRFFHLEGPDPSYKWAGGGILTTPSDLVLMGGTFMTDKIIKNDSLFHPQPLLDGKPNPENYALGWINGLESELLGTVDTVAVRLHGGASPGGNSFILLLPDYKIAASVMTNYSLKDAWPLRSTLYKIAGNFQKNLLIHSEND